MAGQAPPGMPKQTFTFVLPAALSATTDPIVRFKANVGMTPLSVRCTPLTEFDRADGNETYVLSVEDDGVKVSTDNAAVQTATKTEPIEATFASGTYIAKGSVVEIILTLGGTSPSVPARSLIELDFLADG